MIATALPSAPAGGLPAAARGSGLKRALALLVSFELWFALALYANSYKLLIGYQPPVDENIILAGVTVLLAIPILLREGLHLRALPTILAFALFVAWAAFSFAWTPSRKLAPVTLTYYLTFLPWALIGASFVLAANRERCLRFLLIVFCLSLFLSGYGLWIYLTEGNFKYYVQTVWEVKAAYQLWSYATASGAVIGFFFAIYAKFMSWRQIAFFSGFAVMISFLFVSASRGALIGTLLACLLFVLFMPWRLSRGRFELSRAQLVAAVLGLSALGFAAYAFVAGLEFETINRFRSLLREAANPELLLRPNRFRYYEQAVELFLRYPLIGTGLDGFSLFTKGREVYGTHPHNIFLEAAANLGIVGLGLLVLFFWTAVRHLRLQRFQADPLLLCAAGLFALHLFSALVSVDLARHYMLFAFTGLLCLRPPAARSAAAVPVRLAAPTPATTRLRRLGMLWS